VLHLQWHEELAATTSELLLNELNVLVLDGTLLSGNWRAIVYYRLQRLRSDLVRAFGAAAY
jgi:thiamine phosphate synthase YjbQ (UPF0047 family)